MVGTSGDQEEWRDVPGWEGLYQVSSEGRINSLHNYRPGSGGILTQTPNVVSGYLYVGMQRVGQKRKNRAVHIVVCEAFHGPRPTPEMHAAHWNGDLHNNREGNLRWATPIENAEDQRRHGTRPTGLRHHCAKLSDEQAREIRAAPGLHREIAAQYGVSRSLVQRIKGGIARRQA